MLLLKFGGASRLVNAHWFVRGGCDGERFIVLVKRGRRGGTHRGVRFAHRDAFSRSLIELWVERDGALGSDKG